MNKLKSKDFWNATYSDYESAIKSNLQLTNDLSSLIALLKSKNVI